MSILRQKTRKLFYGKWPYKIECYLKGSSNVARLGLLRTTNWLNGDTVDNWMWKGADRNLIGDFVKKVAPFMDTEETRIRVEGAHFNIFVKDKYYADTIISELEYWIQRVTEPGSEEEYQFLLNNSSKKIICNELPKGKYKYRIYIRERMKLDSRKRFHDWTLRYKNRFEIAKSTTKWLTGQTMYTQNPFLYIETHSDLSMVSLYLGENIKRIEEFIPRTNINT